MKVHHLIKILKDLPSHLDVMVEDRGNHTKKIQVFVGFIRNESSKSNQEVLFIERKSLGIHQVRAVEYGCKT